MDGSRIASMVFVGLTLLLGAMSAYILVVPVDANDFESTTGVSWDAFSDSNPAVADYLAREARLLAVGFVGLALISAAIGWSLVRGAVVAVPRVLWLFPLTLWAAAAVFIGGDGAVLGAVYVAAGVAAAGALFVAQRGERERTDVMAGGLQ